jgi:hypothetical protein
LVFNQRSKTMGLSKDYSKVPAWEHKATGYKTGEKV